MELPVLSEVSVLGHISVHLGLEPPQSLDLVIRLYFLAHLSRRLTGELIG